MKYQLIYCLFCFVVLSCNNKTKNTDSDNSNIAEVLKDTIIEIEQQKDYKTLILKDTTFISEGFDFPVGKPNAKGYYNAQKFQENNHLGDDWNGVGGGDSDLGDPIYAIANGYISEVKDYEGGWGNVIRIVHLHNNQLYESLYAHCDSILVNSNRFIKKGEQVATIGNCNGAYFAHLHLEIRNEVDLDIGGGYSEDTTGYLDPTDFIKKNRN
ncbi:M23 family metallopeptidase [uncultured Winogradskyella sp.]|uniref:M23 family metallopeptidase n=1 Tax=uncultured Winogradskyella sp. TaxID=395353 RepID=UPI0030EC65CA|tara:strand:+ start:568 stop:1203 length:636 start_codon:yes stop_codon:yes gene_type:complete